jgi:Flp pilus assembly protein TadG
MIQIYHKLCSRWQLQKFISDQRGISTVEFGLLGSLFLTFLMGVFDIGYGVYSKAILQGALEEAGRTASLENTTDAAIDTKISNQVNAINNAANITITRSYYENYDDVALPEDFTDADNDGTKDANECFVDRNGNKQWDADVGLSGRGGAQDVVAFTATMQYTKLFPLWKLLGQSDQQTLRATTHLRNQPFSAQAGRVGVNICPAP